MDMSEYAKLALEWEELTRKAQAIAAVLEEATLKIGKTQTIGNVRVTYSNPRKTFDYLGAWKAEYGDELPAVEFEKVTYDYRGACKSMGLEVEAVAGGAPSARIKLIA